MRQQIDVAILHQAINSQWFRPLVTQWAQGMARIRFHDLDWEPPLSSEATTGLRWSLLVDERLRLRRYDILLLPVSVATLSWTRQLLSMPGARESIAVFGVLSGVQSAAMVDLMQLGMVDMVCTPVHEGEVRARLICALHRAPLREEVEPDSVKPKPRTNRVEPANPLGEFLPIPGRSRSFQEAKSALIKHFEQQYVCEALTLQQGNVARAAAASGKNRRAFWELMRKHQIDAGPFRDATHAEAH